MTQSRERAGERTGCVGHRPRPRASLPCALSRPRASLPRASLPRASLPRALSRPRVLARAALPAAAALLFGAALAPPAPAGAIELVLAADFSGRFQEHGARLRRGALQAIADINAKGGVLGQQLRFAWVDDACDEELGAVWAHQLAAQKAPVVIGHYCDGPTLSAAPVYGKGNILHIAPYTTSPRLNFVGRSLSFRLPGRDDQQGVEAGLWLVRHFKRKRIAIIDDELHRSRVLADHVLAAFEQGSRRAILRDTVPLSARPYGALVERLKSLDAEVVYFAGAAPSLAAILRQSKKAGLDAIFITSLPHPILPELVAREAGKKGGRLYLNALASAETEPAGRSLARRMAKSGVEAHNDFFYGYAAVELWAKAAEAAKSTSGISIASILHGRAFKTAIGELRFGGTGDRLDLSHSWFQWDGEALAPAGYFRR